MVVLVAANTTERALFAPLFAPQRTSEQAEANNLFARTFNDLPDQRTSVVRTCSLSANKRTKPYIGFVRVRSALPFWRRHVNPTTADQHILPERHDRATRLRDIASRLALASFENWQTPCDRSGELANPQIATTGR